MCINLNVIHYCFCTQLGAVIYVLLFTYGFLFSSPADANPLQAFSLLISLYLTGSAISTWFIFKIPVLRTFYESYLGKEYIKEKIGDP
ncbi:hypothetical protein EON70_00990 [bacterium]|nr:MAG: hypothetical protein EON70_00990 [bacterium]